MSINIITYPQGILRKIEIFIERALYGHSAYDRSSFDYYLMEVVSNYTTNYLEGGILGVPWHYCHETVDGECTDEQEWASVIYAINDGANTYLDNQYDISEEEQAVIELGKELLMENLSSLWT